MNGQATTCRACGAFALKFVGDCAAFAKGSDADPGKLYRCSNCHLGLRVPCPEVTDLIDAYEHTQESSMDYQFEENCGWMAARTNLSEAFRASGSVRILDIGCHTGNFLAGLPESWHRFGIEMAEGPRRVAAESHQVTLIGDRIETLSPEWQGQFDAVTLFDVVEHLVDPLDGLRRAAGLLRPGGRLLVSTGDLDAWTWRWSEGSHWYLQTPLHICVASAPFFEFFARSASLQTQELQRIPHQRGSAGRKLRESMETVYWRLRERGGWRRAPQRLIHSVPGLRDLRHLRAVPWNMALRDHIFASFVQPVNLENARSGHGPT